MTTAITFVLAIVVGGIAGWGGHIIGVEWDRQQAARAVAKRMREEGL